MSRDISPRDPTTVGGISILASGLVNDVEQEFACARHTIHPSPVPRDARRDALASRPQRQPDGCGYIVRGQSTGRYLPASPPRVLVMGRQVRSWRGQPDNDSGSFLSREVKPVQQMLRVRVEGELRAYQVPLE